jgi:hypothetical protein
MIFLPHWLPLIMRAWKFLIFASCILLAPSLRAQGDLLIPNLSLSSGILGFGQVAVGSCKDTTIVISDIGCDSLTNLVVEVNAPFFLVNSKPISLGPGDSDSLQIIFKPTLAGFDSESLQLRMNFAGIASLVIDTSLTLEGSGIKQQDILPGENIPYGSVPVGTIWRSPVIIGNNFPTDTQFVSWSLLNPPFSIVDSGGTTILPGASDTVTIFYKPTATGFDTQSFYLIIRSPGEIDSFLYTLSGTGVASQVGAQSAQAGPLDLACYPNPASSAFEISYNLDQPSSAELKLYDMIGNEVATLSDGDESAGLYSVAFNTNKYSSGEYLCLLRITNLDGTISSNYCKVVIAKP